MKKLEFCISETDLCLRSLVVKDPRAEILIKFARDYFSDALHYRKKEVYDTALEATAYAHGFIDAGVLLGLIEIPGYHLEKSA